MKLSFELADGGSPRTLDFEARRLVIAGWTGRDAAAIAHHIEELAALGVPAPSAVPLFYRVAINHCKNRIKYLDRRRVVRLDRLGPHRPRPGGAQRGAVQADMRQARGAQRLAPGRRAGPLGRAGALARSLHPVRPA